MFLKYNKTLLSLSMVISKYLCPKRFDFIAFDFILLFNKDDFFAALQQGL